MTIKRLRQSDINLRKAVKNCEPWQIELHSLQSIYQ